MGPIPGTKRRAYLEENVAAVGITLTPADLERIDQVAPKNIAAGDSEASKALAKRGVSLAQIATLI
jgi:diketogulonate reductase-like aldo/keto reductase